MIICHFSVQLAISTCFDFVDDASWYYLWWYMSNGDALVCKLCILKPTCQTIFFLTPLSANFAEKKAQSFFFKLYSLPRYQLVRPYYFLQGCRMLQNFLYLPRTQFACNIVLLSAPLTLYRLTCNYVDVCYLTKNFFEEYSMLWIVWGIRKIPVSPE